MLEDGERQVAAVAQFSFVTEVTAPTVAQTVLFSSNIENMPPLLSTAETD